MAVGYICETMNNNKVSYNGELIDSNLNYFKDNRAFKYGDGVFESIRVINGSIFDFQPHFERLIQGAELLSIEIPSYFSLDFFKTEISKLLNANEIKAGGGVRLHLFRKGAGNFLSDSNEPEFLITAKEIQDNLYKLNEEGYLMDIYSQVRKEKNILANLKTGNSLLYVMAMNDAAKKGNDGAFILNNVGNIIETADSNLFLVSNGVLYTPPLTDGCVGGTMRMRLINTAIKHKIKVYESTITPQNLLAADEVVLTNAIKGVQWVGGYKTKRYYNQMARTLIGLVNGEEASLKLDLQGNSQSL